MRCGTRLSPASTSSSLSGADNIRRCPPPQGRRWFPGRRFRVGSLARSGRRLFRRHLTQFSRWVDVTRPRNQRRVNVTRNRRAFKQLLNRISQFTTTNIPRSRNGCLGERYGPKGKYIVDTFWQIAYIRFHIQLLNVLYHRVFETELALVFLVGRGSSDLGRVCELRRDPTALKKIKVYFLPGSTIMLGRQQMPFGFECHRS